MDRINARTTSQKLPPRPLVFSCEEYTLECTWRGRACLGCNPRSCSTPFKQQVPRKTICGLLPQGDETRIEFLGSDVRGIPPLQGHFGKLFSEVKVS